MRVRAIAVLCVLLAFSVAVFGQPGKVEVYHATKQDVSPPLRNIPPGLSMNGPENDHPVRGVPLPAVTTQQDSAVQTTTTTAAPANGINFDGLGAGFTGFTVDSAPPDTNGSVGATQFVQWVNESFAVFDKTTGVLLYGPAAGNTLWSGFGGPCQTDNDGDPIALYDKQANRWIMTQFAVTGGPPFYQCIAVSQTSDATGAWNRYAFQFTQFNDYPKIGVWPDAYYMTFNMFSGATGPFQGAKVCALDRGSMLAGAPATAQCFQLSTSFGGLLPADLDGLQAPPPASPGHFLNFGTNSLNIWHMHVDFATPANTTLSSPTNFAVAAFTPACSGGTCIPQPGTRQKLDSLADRVMYRLAYRNFGTFESLVVNHSVAATVSGVSTVGVRWYEIRNPNGTPTVWQQGTFAPDTDYRWMGTVAMDHLGDMALGYSVSSGSTFPSIRYTGRLVNDLAGTMSAESSMMAGTGSQLTKLNRWGDYSSISVDPIDDCTMWFTTEYLKTSGTFDWSTRIGTIRFSTCSLPPTAVSVTPNSGSGNTQTFAFQFNDPNGFADISTIQAKFGTDPNSLVSNCSLAYSRSSNGLYLMPDNGANWMGPLTVGSAGTLQNSQCSINLGASSASGSGAGFTLSLAVTFQSGFFGAKNVYGWVQNAASQNSGWQTLGNWTIGSTAPPSAVSVTPNSGSGTNQVFAFQFSDPNGFADMSVMQTKVGTDPNSYVSNCSTAYVRSSNTLYLMPDSGSNWLGPATVGSAGTLQNSQCTIDLGASSASGSGTNFTLSLSTTFGGTFAGTKSLYGWVQNNAGQTSGWQTLGSWTNGSTAPPSAVSVTPNSGSGASQVFAFQFSDPNGFADMSVMQTKVGTDPNSYVSNCSTAYVRSSNALYLMPDGGSNWLGPATVGSAGTLQNSQCTIDLGASSASGSGTNFTLSLSTTFGGTFTGTKSVYGWVQNNAGQTSGWQTLGSWTH